jgi:Ca-activated chloride channel family protein
VVAYSGEAFTKVPVTSDHQVVIDEQKSESTGTSAGNSHWRRTFRCGKSFENSKAKSKVIILMTDGVNNIENAMPPQLLRNWQK